VRNDELQPKIVEALQDMWQRELGVRVSIALLEQKVSIANQQALNYTIGLNGWVADFADPVTFLDLFTTGGGNNWTGWSKPRIRPAHRARRHDRRSATALRTFPTSRGHPPRAGRRSSRSSLVRGTT